MSVNPTDNEYFKEEHILKEDLILPIKLLKNKYLSSNKKLIISFLIMNRNENEIEATSNLSISKNLGLSISKIKGLMFDLVENYNFITPTSTSTYIVDVELLFHYLNQTNERFKIITSDIDMDVFNKVDYELNNWTRKKSIKIQDIVTLTGITAISIRGNYPNFNNVVKKINLKIERDKRPIVLDDKGNNMNTKKYIKRT